MKKSQKFKRFLSVIEKTKNILTYILVAAVVILIVMTAAQKLGNMTISTFTSDVKTYFLSLGSGDGYPYSLESDEVADVVVNKSNLNLLLNDKTMALTSSAKEIMSENHSFSSPAMKMKGSKMIVYDLDSGKFRIQSGADILWEHSESGKITAAAIGVKGSFAVAYYEDSSKSVFKVYGKNKKEKLSHDFVNERIIDVDLSPNGKFAAVAAAKAVNGEMTSKLYVFNIGSGEVTTSFDYPSTTLLRINYVKGNNIAVLGDNLRSYIKNNRDRQEDLSFNSDKLHNYRVAQNGSSVLVLSKYGSTSLSSLTFYNNKNKERFTEEFDKEAKWVDTDGKYTAVLFDSEVRTYNSRGKQVGTIYFSGEPDRVVIDGSRTYVLTSVNIKSYKTRGTTDERQVSE